MLIFLPIHVLNSWFFILRLWPLNPHSGINLVYFHYNHSITIKYFPSFRKQNNTQYSRCSLIWVLIIPVRHCSSCNQFLKGQHTICLPASFLYLHINFCDVYKEMKSSYFQTLTTLKILTLSISHVSPIYSICHVLIHSLISSKAPLKRLPCI